MKDSWIANFATCFSLHMQNKLPCCVLRSKLCRPQIEKFSKIYNNLKLSFSAGNHVFGYNFMHKFVERLASNASAISGISGFSDDDVDDPDDVNNVVTSNDILSIEPRQYGLISSSVYFAYLQSGGLVQVVLFLLVSLLFEGSKVFMDFLLRDWSLVPDGSSSHSYVVWYFILSALVLAFSFAANLLSQSVCAKARRILHSKRHLKRVRRSAFLNNYCQFISWTVHLLTISLASCLQIDSLPWSSIP